jgi:hypothetical protein
MVLAKCHPSRRHIAHGLCSSCFHKSCGYLAQEKYRRSHPEKMRAINRGYVERHRDEVNARRRHWRATHPDEVERVNRRRRIKRWATQYRSE